jgi:flagellar biosynthesis/type III secretory pathway protein FliH
VFVSLSETLRAAQQPPQRQLPAPSVAEPAPAVAGARGSTNAANEPQTSEPTVAAIRDAKLFRARLADALDAAVPHVLRELAASVLARELRLAPCDLAALLDDVVARAPVVRVRVAPEDAREDYPLPIVADATLAPGDAIVELDRGGLDARLGVRLAAILEPLS